MIEKDTDNISFFHTKCTEALWKRYGEGIIPIIPDIKIKSPGEGELLKDRDPIQYAKALEKAGAPVISVVTENEHYGGSLEILHEIAQAVSVPVLRKDFITQKWQLEESVRYGASSVLLIASILEQEQLQRLVSEALELGLEPLVEIHNEAEQDTVKKLNLTFIGINNRNILEWETDNGTVRTSERLAKLVNSKVFILSESSITSAEEVRRAVTSGCTGVLAGTAILKANDPVEMYRRLSIPRNIN